MDPELKKLDHTVLVIDDDDFIGSMIAGLIAKAGYQIRRVNTGEDGLKEIEKEKPDLVLLDIGLPGIDGFEVLRRIKENEATKDIAVLVASNYGQQEDVSQTKSLGAIDHLIKANVEPKEIVEYVNNFFANR
jgi:CheY-like chemotaxis protein